MNVKKIAIVSVAFAGLLAAASVDARGRDDVQFSVSIGSPGWVHPVPAYGHPVPAYAHPVPAYGHPVFVAPGYGRHHDRGYRHAAPTRWDRDGDGIPNRYDRLYNPRWDRDGDGVPNRYDRYDNRWSGRRW